MKTFSVVLLLLLSLTAVAKDKPPVTWQTGVLTDVSSERGKRLVPIDGSVISKRDDHTFYTIDAGNMIYVAERGLRSRGDKPLLVAINAEVKFYIKGQDMYLLDEAGKEHKLTIEKQSLKK